jgi:hypothetical protein
MAGCGCCSCEHSQQDHPHSQWCGGTVKHYGDCTEQPQVVR